MLNAVQPGGSTLATAPSPFPYEVTVSREPLEVRAAQRLRHQVFALEMGATLADRQPGIDADDFDAYCDHLLVRHRASEAIVGGPTAAAAARSRRARRHALFGRRI
ncbi:GNAT family N-acetyltransferase [Fodinicola feengrottensis]|uniref:GNAT family N-acetyltransferase n=1 Tax=Fodinicola feengrottensis TaxID=435914 RepID=UPI00244261CC|nr:GNAT family N-acetyltransferase [Fodinicola feengrottensis]